MYRTEWDIGFHQPLKIYKYDNLKDITKLLVGPNLDTYHAHSISNLNWCCEKVILVSITFCPTNIYHFTLISWLVSIHLQTNLD